MLGAPLWTEKGETKINYILTTPEIIVEVDFSAIGAGKKQMKLVNGNKGISYYVLETRITGPSGTYRFPVVAKIKGQDTESRVKYFTYTIE